MKSDFFIGVELTRHCNLRCQHCFRADLGKKAELDFDLYASILEQGKMYNSPHIAFTGGEVTLHSRFREIIDLTVSEGFSFHFVSNAFNFDQTMAEIGHHAGKPYWHGVSISMDGATEKTHDSIRGRGSYRRVMLAISMCKIRGVPVTIQMVINALNRHELLEMARLCSTMEVDTLYYCNMQPTPEGVKAGIVLPPEEWKAIEEEVQSLQKSFRNTITMSAGHHHFIPLSHCRFLRNNALNIDYAGRLTWCCQLSNMRGSVQPGPDVVADLNDIPLADAHAKLLDGYNALHKMRLKHLAKGNVPDLDHFHCWYCMKVFGKLDWMKAHPDSPWVKGDPYFEELRRQSKDPETTLIQKEAW